MPTIKSREKQVDPAVVQEMIEGVKGRLRRFDLDETETFLTGFGIALENLELIIGYNIVTDKYISTVYFTYVVKGHLEVFEAVFSP